MRFKISSPPRGSISVSSFFGDLAMTSVSLDDYDPDKHARPFWEPIGRFVFAFGYLERDVDTSLSRLLKLEYFDEGQMVFGQIRNLSSRILLLGALCNR